MEYTREICCGDSAETVTTVTIKSGRTLDWHFGQTVIKFEGPMNPNASRIILTFDQLAGMEDLVWYWDLD